jgi:hypothetical protein
LIDERAFRPDPAWSPFFESAQAMLAAHEVAVVADVFSATDDP